MQHYAVNLIKSTTVASHQWPILTFEDALDFPDELDSTEYWMRRNIMEDWVICLQEHTGGSEQTWSHLATCKLWGTTLAWSQSWQSAKAVDREDKHKFPWCKVQCTCLRRGNLESFWTGRASNGSLLGWTCIRHNTTMTMAMIRARKPQA